MPGPVIWFKSAFGDIDLHIAQIETEHGRDIVVQSPSRGDKHVLQDRGRRLGRSSAEILFVDVPGLDAFTDRYEAFRNLVNTGTVEIFVHPLDGSYRARIEAASARSSSESHMISVSCTIIPEDEPQTTFPVGGGVAPAAGFDAVNVAVDDANTDLAAAGLSSSVPGSCLSTVTAWTQATDLDSQEVYMQVETLTGQIAQAIDDLELASDIQRWQAYQSMVRLSYEVTRAAEALTTDSAQVFDLVITAPMPLLAICADVYGPEDAPDQAAKAAKINRIRTPGRVPAGTTLKMPPRRVST